MRYRKLRIAWSVVWGIACLLLVVLCVRSYWTYDNLIGPPRGSHRFNLASGDGWLTIHWSDQMPPGAYPRWSYNATSAAQMEEIYRHMEESIRNEPKATFERPAFKFGLTGDGGIQFPYWFPAVVVGALAAAPWLKRRFSLRTLLIATTLIALVLGLAVYATRQ